MARKLGSRLVDLAAAAMVVAADCHESGGCAELTALAETAERTAAPWCQLVTAMKHAYACSTAKREEEMHLDDGAPAEADDADDPGAPVCSLDAAVLAGAREAIERLAPPPCLAWQPQCPAAARGTPEPCKFPDNAARLSVNAIPQASIFIAGCWVGITPVFGLTIPPGAHEVTFEWPGRHPTKRHTGRAVRGEYTVFTTKADDGDDTP